MCIVKHKITNMYICYDINLKELGWCNSKDDALNFDSENDARQTVFFMKVSIDDVEVIKI